MKKITKLIFLFLINLVLALNASAQDFSGILFPTKSIDYLGQVGTNGKEKNGMGCFKTKNGEVFVGDFSRGLYHGSGIMFAPKSKTLDKCQNGQIYVGKWFRGKKEGIGRLYDEAGSLIYNGRFSNDKPTGEFPHTADTTSRFEILQLEDEIYIGETSNNSPNGFGIFYDSEGFFTICRVKEGNQYGVGIMLLPPYEWAVFNIENDLYYQIASSKEQRARNSFYQANRERERIELLNTFSGLLNESTQIIADINSIVNRTSENTTTSENFNYTSNDRSESDRQNSNDKYNMSDQRNYNRDKSTYSKYDSMLASAFAGNKNASASEIKEWQSTMKKLREKWEKKGKNFPHSANEDR